MSSIKQHDWKLKTVDIKKDVAEWQCPNCGETVTRGIGIEEKTIPTCHPKGAK